MVLQQERRSSRSLRKRNDAGPDFGRSSRVAVSAAGMESR